MSFNNCEFDSSMAANAQVRFAPMRIAGDSDRLPRSATKVGKVESRLIGRPCRRRPRLAGFTTLSLFGLLASSAISSVSAQGRFDWAEFGTRANATGDVASMSTQILGDGVDLYGGGLSFSVTDVELPGTGPAVRFTRRFSVKSRDQYARYNDHAMRDWEIALPSISGTYAPDWMPQGSLAGKRCSISAAELARPPTQIPLATIVLESDSYWNGIQLDLPDGGGGELLFAREGAPMPTQGGPYRWLTSAGARVSCLSELKNRPGGGEGFRVVAPDGLTYDFDHMAQFEEAPITLTSVNTEGSIPRTSTWTTGRRTNALYPTKVSDRFGNTVSYIYANAWNQPMRLVQILASDGRRIDISYLDSGNRISKVAANGANCAQLNARCWTYGYRTLSKPSRYVTLNQVRQPDGHFWSINFEQWADARIETSDSSTRSCWNLPDLDEPTQFTASVVHPAGLRGDFTVGIEKLGLAQVPLWCKNVTRPANDPIDDVANVGPSYHAFVLRSKTLSGPGLPPRQWLYSFERTISHVVLNVDSSFPFCPIGRSDCAEPICSSASCAGTARTLITEPGGRWERHTFGNTYGYDEGKLLKVEVGQGADVLRSTSYQHDLSQQDGAYLARWGFSPRFRRDGFSTEYHRPTVAMTTAQQGVNFERAISSFDSYARPTAAVGASTIPGVTPRSELTDYYDDSAKWVVGLVARRQVNGVEISRATYNSRAQVDSVSTNGLLEQSILYHADGNVASTTDGRSRTTSFTDWYRGVPRTVKFPPTAESPQGAEVAAVVDANGWIRSSTDENSFTTDYDYDAMGRLKLVGYPIDGSVEWAPKTIAFVKETNPAFGLGSGHWRQTTQTGNGVRTLRFDAMWRPVVEETVDASVEGSTRSLTVKRYDEAGQLSFESYPVRSLTDYQDPALKGTRSTFDALGRLLSTATDAENGLIFTMQNRYLPGFVTETTNPRAKVTRTHYMAWDEPTFDFPVRIESPEQVVTQITRDVFGKPSSIERSGGD